MNDEQKLVWDEISKIGWQYQKSMDKLSRKQVGAYYTDLYLTDTMITQLFSEMPEDYKNDIYTKTFFEPCLGVGNFVFSYLKYISLNFKLKVEQVNELLTNIYVCESDKKSIEIFTSVLGKFVEAFFGVGLPSEFHEKNIGNALIFDVEKRNIELLKPQKYFDFDVEKFDIVVTNPPYKGFRAESKHYDDENSHKADKEFYELLKREIKNSFKFQGKGSPNLYKLFVEEIVTCYLKEGGFSYLLIPQSILKDQSSTDLRKLFLNNMNIKHIYTVDEQTNFIDAKQALAAILIRNEIGGKNFTLVNHFGTSKEEEHVIEVDEVSKNINSAIISLSDDEMIILKKMNSYRKISDYSCISNLRGELDLTINKSAINEEKGFPLIRGRNLSTYNLKPGESSEFVRDDFVDNSNKNQYILSDRIACPQISNMSAKKRLFFCFVPKNNVLGNSCNFIGVIPNNEGIDLFFLLGILNSDIYDWYFKIFSSNNHINNYEIDNFPIPDSSTEDKNKLSSLVKDNLESMNEDVIMQINHLVKNMILDNTSNIEISVNKDCFRDIKTAFPKLDEITIKDFIDEGISYKDSSILKKLSSFEAKVLQGIVDKYKTLTRGEVLNHSSFKLSDLDLEMVRSVKPGGNWKQIPEIIAQKSKRLMRIRDTGGRTTLYGRLDYKQPSYTITTYFNRPGNGTNIHPIHDRVLSVREAARIQSFPDDFYFYGSKKDKLNQIGNAVPPMMAYQIAKKIKDQVDVQTSLDLFNGAGGMTTGFKLAGYHSVMINDIDEAALVTAKINYPSAEAFVGDLTIEKNKEYIIKHAISQNVDIINGGPPCQGFSLAGFRNPDDPRSKLIYEYVDVLKEVQPKVFVFENVQGLLSHEKGNTFRELLKMFSDIGYKTEAKLLDFSDYGIPQKRKRVIIIGVKSELNILPELLFPNPLTSSGEDKITVGDALLDLENVSLDEKSYYNDECESRYVKALQNNGLDDYFNELSQTAQIDNESDNIYNQLSLF
ncbi:Alw26I/Eco31I/Esp3I family type II restriction adenine-specific DNA-methyltransferase [Listeria monocytogenes]|nr:Alw26I/Eco31I/Esp3I family type II restriction adenine-specific DNA-methyltransferase [Listeria monocytogenes]